MKIFYFQNDNFGDILSPIITEYFLGITERAKGSEQGKILLVGSVISRMKENDVVIGSGLIKDTTMKVPKGARVLAVRGPLTRNRLSPKPPKVYGDPAILMPLIYYPDVKKTKDYGVIPHFIEKEKYGNEIIDIKGDWKEVINQVLACRMIYSSSLHGIVIAEAYGIPAVWLPPGKGIIGGRFKFKDYFLGTGRRVEPNQVAPLPNLKKLQNNIIKCLKKI